MLKFVAFILAMTCGTHQVLRLYKSAAESEIAASTAAKEAKAKAAKHFTYVARLAILSCENSELFAVRPFRTFPLLDSLHARNYFQLRSTPAGKGLQYLGTLNRRGKTYLTTCYNLDLTGS
eukprot:scaffold6369_cov77-Skeletonema_dohrnii-CCMP3373.AAC.3